jgi:peroxiredoxin Q/BCP
MTGNLKSRIIGLFESRTNKKITGLVVGMTAPDFSLPDQNGTIFTLSENRGRKLVLYFYPKDNTSGCTLQSCNLRDHYSELRDLGYEVLGISNDDMISHRKFISDFRLPFRLLVDIDREVVRLYDVYGEKNVFGIRMQGINRTTFVISKEGIIEKIITQIDTANHTNQILEK